MGSTNSSIPQPIPEVYHQFKQEELVELSENITSIFDKLIEKKVIMSIDIGISIGVAECALKMRNNRAHTQHEQNICGAYGVIIALIENIIISHLCINTKSGDVLRNILTHKSNLLGSNSAMSLIINTEPYINKPLDGVNDYHTEMMLLVNSNSITDMQTCIGRIIRAIECTQSECYIDVIASITAHINGMETTDCLKCKTNIGAIECTPLNPTIL